MSNTTILCPTRRDPPPAISARVRPATARPDPQVSGPRSEKVTEGHLQRLAIVYVCTPE